LDEDKKEKRLANIELERQRSTQSGGAVSFNAFWDEIERLEKVRIVKFMQSLLFDTFTRETSPKNSAASLADGSEPKSESKEPEDEQKETTGPASEAEVRDGKQGNSDGENGTGLSSKAVRIHVSIPDVSTGKDNSATISLTPPLRAATETTDAVLPDIETPGRASPNPGNGSNQSGMFSYKPRILAKMRSPSSFAPNPSKVVMPPPLELLVISLVPTAFLHSSSSCLCGFSHGRASLKNTPLCRPTKSSKAKAQTRRQAS